MSESIKTWCEDAFFAMHDALSQGLTVGSETITSPGVESLVNAAAFERMLHSRRLGSRLTQTPFSADHPSIRELWNGLVERCPLGESSPPEILGFIHENLVALRSAACQTGVRRNSMSRNSTSRKANGIFYTPSYVIAEILSKTLDPRLTNAVPDEVDRLKLLDPTAGCGAFLVAAFRRLMTWHLDWLKSHQPEQRCHDIVQTKSGWKLTIERCRRIVVNNLFGVDLDGSAIDVTRRTLWLTLLDSAESQTHPEASYELWDEFPSNFKQGSALTGPVIGEDHVDGITVAREPESAGRFVWFREFPRVAESGGFDMILGNPPYRRERDFKQQLDEIRSTPWGGQYHSARMDLWYYFLHRGIELLKRGGTLSFITSAYWIHGRGSDKLIEALRQEVHLDELFLLRDQPVFPGILGQHLILRLTKESNDNGTSIKVVPREPSVSAEPFVTGLLPVTRFVKTRDQLFRNGSLDVGPASDTFLESMSHHPRLGELGKVRQGIAENPAAINRRTIERFQDEPLSKDWRNGQGVFSLLADEVEQLALLPHEVEILRPYHDLCDLGRYWSASLPSRQLIYTTRITCPDIGVMKTLRAHLARFRPILDARRETQKGSNDWWHLHWPRDETLWRANKLIVLQMAMRPSVVPTFSPVYVPFSANVFVPSRDVKEDLRYLCGLLNSRVLWGWFEHHAKRRGIGLELNGHVLDQAPIRRINFENPDEVRDHDEMVELVHQRMKQQRIVVESTSRGIDETETEIQSLESRIDEKVALLYGLNEADRQHIHAITHNDCGSARGHK